MARPKGSKKAAGSVADQPQTNIESVIEKGAEAFVKAVAEKIEVTETPEVKPDPPLKVFQTEKTPGKVPEVNVPFYDKAETTKENDGQTLHLVRRNGTEFWWSRAMIILTSRNDKVEVIGDGSIPKTNNSLEFPRNTEIVLEPASKSRCAGCQ